MKHWTLLLASLLLFVGFSFFSCKESSDEENYCNSTNPTKNIWWLKEMINTQKQEYHYPMVIYKCSYKESEGFLVVSYAESSSLNQYYNCVGNLVCEYGGSANVKTCEDFPEKATLGGQIYSDTSSVANPF